ncbi:Ivy family c-type lysozyme inhibitor [Rhizobium sp. CAU 1783]
MAGRRHRGWTARAIMLGLGISVLGPLASRAAEPTLSGNFLPALVAGSEPHRAALETLIKGRPGLPPWVRNMIRQPRYVALASTRVETGGVAMQLFTACEAGRCEESRISVLFSADGKRAVARIVDRKLGEKLLGDPSAEELGALLR